MPPPWYFHQFALKKLPCDSWPSHFNWYWWYWRRQRSARVIGALYTKVPDDGRTTGCPLVWLRDLFKITHQSNDRSTPSGYRCWTWGQRLLQICEAPLRLGEVRSQLDGPTQKSPCFFPLPEVAQCNGEAVVGNWIVRSKRPMASARR
jgi:hypothetical protein